MSIPSAKAIGQRGSWYATVNGERLPCIHQANMRPDGTYQASNVSDAPHDALLAAVKESGKVIVRKSVRSDPDGPWAAKGYLAVFSVADPKIEDDMFSLRFVERLVNLNG